MIEIDGSYGEGGGQIVRTSLALAAYLGIPCRISDIRKKRPNPGLRPQHAAGVKALASLCGAEVMGGEVGSTQLIFYPGQIRGGDILIDVGTAGAITLVLQTLMPPTIKAPPNITLTIRGGTDVPWAPTIGYCQWVLFPILKRLGYKLEVSLIKRGYYPIGGGEVRVSVVAASPRPITISESGMVKLIRGISHASNHLKGRSVAERQRDAAVSSLSHLGIPIEIETSYADTPSPGSGIDLWAEGEETILGANALGARGKQAEDVGKQAAAALIRQMESAAGVDEWLGDQILPFLAIAGGESTISTPCITEHLKTNLWVIRRFFPIETRISQQGRRWFVSMRVTD